MAFVLTDRSWLLSDLQQCALERNFALDVSPEAATSSILIHSLISGFSSRDEKVFKCPNSVSN